MDRIAERFRRIPALADKHRSHQIRWSGSRIAGLILLGVAFGAAPEAFTATVDPVTDSIRAQLHNVADPKLHPQEIARAALDIQTRASLNPAQDGSATVVVRIGMSSTAIQLMADAGNLEIERVEAKIPVVATGDTWTVSIGGYDLAGASGDISTRIDAAVEKMREQFRLMASAATTGSELTQYQYLSAAPFRFYTINVVGTLSSLSALTRRDSVAAVFADPTPNKASAYRQYLGDVRSALSKAAAEGSAKSGSSGLGSGKPITHCCGSPVPHPPSTVPAPIKDPVVDATMNGLYDLSGSPNAAAAYNLFVACGRGSAVSPARPELNCPNDYTYTPSETTGGLSKSWRAGIRRIGGPVNYYDCSLVYHPPTPGPDTDYYTWNCGYTTVNLPKRTIGVASARIMWGTTAAFTGTQYRPVSTLAFNASEMKHCVPSSNVILTGAIASDPCNPTSGPDAVYVERRTLYPQVGYEDKIYIPNPNCAAPGNLRLSAPSDQTYRCFWHDSFISDLPAYYIDTNWADSNATYVASVGSADATAIIAGKTYMWKIGFSTPEWEFVAGLSASRWGAVTIRDSAASICLTGLNVLGATDAASGSSAACFFNVDLARLTGNAVFIPY